MTSPIDQLTAAGFRPDEAARRLRLLDIARRGLTSVPDAVRGPRAEYHVPGRLEVLGKHTDYAGGRSIVCATEQGLAVAAVPRRDQRLTILDTTTGESCSIALDGQPDDSAANLELYATTVVRRMVHDLPGSWRGVHVAVASDLPRASGVSSSSALVVGLIQALGDANDWTAHPGHRGALRGDEQLAAYAGAVENGRPFGPFAPGQGVGTLGGDQDHTAILCGRAGVLRQFGWMPVTLERSVPLPEALRFVIATCGVTAEKTGAVRNLYNGIAQRTNRLWQVAELAAPAGCHTLGAALNAGPTVRSAIDRALREVTDRPERDWLVGRLDQLYDECQAIIPEFAAALGSGDLDRLGPLAARSQAHAEAALGNQIPETVGLVRLALEGGAMAASAFGAGFGGSVWALVPADQADAFRLEWQRTYLAAFPLRVAARFWSSRPAPPALRLA